MEPLGMGKPRIAKYLARSDSEVPFCLFSVDRLPSPSGQFAREKR